jgi:hypothetical protein
MHRSNVRLAIVLTLLVFALHWSLPTPVSAQLPLPAAPQDPERDPVDERFSDRDLSDQDLPDTDLPDGDLPDQDLPDGDLPSGEDR